MNSTPLLPVLRIPVLRTSRLRETAAFYIDVLGFQLAQEVPGTVALLRHGPLQLQLWQETVEAAQGCCIRIDEGLDDIFACHARLARLARDRISAPPRLQPWGAWEFSLTDADGNQLVFLQWANSLPGRSAASEPVDDQRQGK